MSWLVSDFVRLNHCLLQSYLQKERWFVQDLLWWWRRGQGGLRCFCPILLHKLPSCRLPSFFFVPVDSQRHKLFLFDKPHTMRGRPLTFKGESKTFYGVKLRERIFRAKSVSSIEGDDHFKEAADAKTKHHIWNTRQNTICSETLERKRTTNKRRRIEEKNSETITKAEILKRS